ncbi:hypothetical protein EDB80DRAFT_688051 [Ilyonectria destructans]|nr:hypothetical protein EDB80DRAFT_688051 [Ilyonectria destructans]
MDAWRIAHPGYQLRVAASPQLAAFHAFLTILGILAMLPGSLTYPCTGTQLAKLRGHERQGSRGTVAPICPVRQWALMGPGWVETKLNAGARDMVDKRTVVGSIGPVY